MCTTPGSPARCAQAYPGLRVCFPMLAGLALLHWERAADRGAEDVTSSHDLVVRLEASSYGADNPARLLGIPAPDLDGVTVS
jgi:hypothetical protein